MAENKSIKSPLANVVPGAADLPRAPAKPAPGWGDREAYDPQALSYGLGTGVRNTLQGMAELPGTAADLFKGFLQRTRELSPVELRGSAPAMDTAAYDAAKAAVQGAAADPVDAARQIRDSLVDYVKQGVATPASTAQFIGENVNPFPSARVPKPGPVLGVIKEKGGNWIRAPRHENPLVEAAALEAADLLSRDPLSDKDYLQNQYNVRLEALGVPKETAPIMAPLYNESPEGAVRFLTEQQDMERLDLEARVHRYFDEDPNRFAEDLRGIYAAQPRNMVRDWANKRLVSYIKSEMGTEGDPLRALAEKNITHWSLNPKDQATLRGLGRRVAREDLYNPLTDRRPSGESALARAWDRAADATIRPGYSWEARGLAEQQGLDNPEQVARALVGEHALKNTKGSTVLDNPDIYSVRKIQGDGLEPQFDHLVDELTNSVNPDSDLPPHLKLKPEQLKGLSVPDAAKLVHKINKWRRENKDKAALAKAENPATFLYKDYPEQGYKWVRLGNPDPNDPRVLANPDKDFLKEAYDYEGSVMGHCVGGYCEKARSGESENFSLRNSKTGEPHVTLEAVPMYTPGRYETAQINIITGEPLAGLDMSLAGKEIKQIKGKGNASPVDRYRWMARDFVNSSAVVNLSPSAARDIRVAESPLFHIQLLRDNVTGKENPIRSKPEIAETMALLAVSRFEPIIDNVLKADGEVDDAIEGALGAPYGSWPFDKDIKDRLDLVSNPRWARENHEAFFSGNERLEPESIYGDKFKGARKTMFFEKIGRALINDPNPKRFIPYEDIQRVALDIMAQGSPTLLPYINDAIEWVKLGDQAPKPQGFAEGGEVRADEQKSPMASQVGGLRELLEGMNEDAQRMESRRKPRSNRQVEEDRRGQELGRGTLLSGRLMQPTLATEGPLMVQRFAEGGAVNSPVEAARQIRDSLVEYARQGVPSALSTSRFIASRARAKS